MSETRQVVEQADKPAGRSSAMKVLKRAAVGSPMATSRLAHERLGKPTALAIFASDNLSSSAYATEEILRVLMLPATVGIVAFSYVIPITFALLAVLAILLFSYRQTIKAYPSAGGAYLVTRDNFGLLPAQVAGVSLLTDYILTVSVSVSAGTAALTSAVPSLFSWRVPLSVGFIAIITWGNLRGVRESGKLFAAPTYFFVAMMAVLIGTGLFRVVTGSIGTVETFEMPAETQALTWFVVLRAFASGGAAVTGVEAISNGVTAFRPVEWRNARTTLMWMGSLLAVMFFGLSILASRLHVVPDHAEKVTVNAQIARAVFGASPGGRVMFFGMQVATFVILVLAANTSYQGFPRLAASIAADRFLPRQLTRYGDRLVYSNGILVLATLAAALVIAFRASVTRLIPLYAIGVFTGFTFSQAGMAVRHSRLREPGWRRGFVVNAVGAIVSGVMTVIIALTKFTHGAWIILVAMPALIVLLVLIHRHYDHVARRLRDPVRRPSHDIPMKRVVIPVDRPGDDDRFAVAYSKLLSADEVQYVHIGPPGVDLLQAWDHEGVSTTFEFLPPSRSLTGGIRAYVRELRTRARPGELINVVIPEQVTGTGPAYYLFRQPQPQLLKAALLGEPNVVVTNVTLHEDFEAPGPDEIADWRHVAVVLVNAAHNATLGALRYARSLRCDEIHCIHIEDSPSESRRLQIDWDAVSPGFPLEVIESPYRLIAEPVVEWVHRYLRSSPRTLVTVVVADFVVTKWWENLLHNQNALELKRHFLFEPSVIVTSVPYRLRPEVGTAANWF